VPPQETLLELAGIPVEAVSVGGLETCIQLPSFKLALDIGRCPPSALRQKLVLLTHGHMDHAAGLPYHAHMRALRGQGRPTYVVPHQTLPALEGLFEAFHTLTDTESPCTFVPLGPGEQHVFGRTIVRPFKSFHRVPSQGYSIWSRRSKLKAAYQDLPGADLGRLRREGVDISDEVEVAEVAFSGDSLIDIVDHEEVVRTARLLILEVTFLDEKVGVKKARAQGHVHLDELIARADRLQNEAILLTHFSARYGPREIKDILAARLPPGLRERVTPLLPHPTWC
jgi:ribonuclease Z